MYTHLELTKREREVLILLAKTGNGNKQIGKMMHLSHKTIERVISSAIDKLEVKNRVQLVIYAYCTGMVEKDEGFPQLQQAG